MSIIHNKGLSYASSISPITLKMDVCYDDTLTNCPIICLGHGYRGDLTDIANNWRERLVTNYGLFVVAVAMRGRSSSGGTPDSGALELCDYVDAARAAYASYPSRINWARRAVYGFSGSGGNVMSLAVKYPEFFHWIIDMFGMTDYAAFHDEYLDAAETVELWVGGTPAEVPDNYAARNIITAAGNNSRAKIYVYHDTQDIVIPVHHSRDFVAATTALGYTNIVYTETTVGDPVRAVHEYPGVGNSFLVFETTFGDQIANGTIPNISISSSGTLTVINDIETDSFRLLLDSLIQNVATFTYNNTTGVYSITNGSTGNILSSTLSLYNKTPNTSFQVTVGTDVSTISSTADGDLIISSIPVAVGGTTSITVEAEAAPSITQQPNSLSVPTGSSAEFSVTATGIPSPSYQWYKDGEILTDSGNISGSQTATLTITTSTEDNEGSYYVVISNGILPNATSETVTLTVELVAAPVITQQPNSLSVPTGSSAEFSVTATGIPSPSYQWYKDGEILTDSGNISGSQTATLTITTSTEDNEGSYYVVVSNGILPNATSNTVTLTVNIAPSITQQPVSLNVSEGDISEFSVTATGIPSPSYQWYKDGEILTDSGNVSGSQTATLTITTSTEDNEGSYYVVVSNGILPNATSETVTLTIYGLMNFPGTVNVASLSLVIGTPILNVDFQTISIPYTGYATPTTTDADITVYEYSTDNGSTWETMTLNESESDLSDLTFDASGEAYTIVWEAKTDLGMDIYNNQIRLRMRARCLFDDDILNTAYATKNLFIERTIVTSNQAAQTVGTLPTDYKGVPGSNMLKRAPKTY